MEAQTTLSEEQWEQILRNPNFDDKSLLKELALLFKDRPDAIEYLYLYGQLCEMIDDLVDEPKNVQRVEEVSLLRMKLSTCAYWQKYQLHLWMTERLIDRQYWDTVEWEKSNIEWQRRDARALNHVAYNMLFGVILLEFGDETLKKLSLRFREHAHKRHLNDPI